MTLRARLLWLFLPLLAASLAGVWLLSGWILLDRFDRNDRQRLYDDVRILSARLDFEKKRYLDIVRTYAWWDASYRYMRQPTEAFVEENLDLDLIGHLGFDFVMFLDPKGHPVAERWNQQRLENHSTLDGSSPPLAQLQADIMRKVMTLGVVDMAAGPGHSLSQWLKIDGVPLMLTSVPISDNTGLAPPRGVLVAGVVFDAERRRRLEEQLDAQLQLLPGTPPADGWRALGTIGPSGTTLVGPRELANGKQRGALLYLDSRGEPQFRIEISQLRQAYEQGREAIQLFLGMASLIVLAALLLAYFALDLWVIRRVQRVNSEAAAIGGESAPARLSDMGRDEIGQLAGELNQMLARLERSEARDRVILESIRDGYFETDGEGNVMQVNAAFCRMLGYSVEEVVGRSYRKLLDPQDIERARDLREQVLQGEAETGFITPIKHRDGRRISFETRVSPVLDAQGQFAGMRGILRDISLQVAYQQRLLDLAYRDTLTGLGNRKAFSEQLPQALQRCAPKSNVALLYIDLDHFKPVNDQFGHAAGDAVLAEVGKRLRESLRQPDLAFRLGGDEFAVLVESTDAPTAERLAARLLESLNADYHAAGQCLDFLSASIGIALYPGDAGEAEALIQAADSAMYQAKLERNRFARHTPS
ncbi:sensor domain-containing diguanylate cyclase [Pseudomonas knackmussii]|uniref:sensor domain-containing diguanylate cyclase n=1 Tax=Pseudomonas knackmussii TaxID=65741 RepID=UPI001363A6E8|nr:diguanylate cyclase [Pseudomonas knackmussii]